VGRIDSGVGSARRWSRDGDVFPAKNATGCARCAMLLLRLNRSGSHQRHQKNENAQTWKK
jgi:hypothetical protein